MEAAAAVNKQTNREEVQALAAWCSDNHLNLNTKKTKKREEVERINSFKFLGLHISEDLGWTVKTTHIIKSPIFFWRTLRRNKLPRPLLKNFYHCTIESVLTYGFTVWLHCI